MRKLLILLAAIGLALGIGVAPQSASANSDSTNVGMPFTYFTCGSYVGEIRYIYSHEHYRAGGLQEYAHTTHFHRLGGSVTITRVISYVADPSYSFGWYNADDRSFGAGVATDDYAVVTNYFMSTGRGRWTVYTSDSSVCTIGADGSLLFGQP